MKAIIELGKERRKNLFQVICCVNFIYLSIIVLCAYKYIKTVSTCWVQASTPAVIQQFEEDFKNKKEME
jgi:hypothetical protein